MGYCVKIKHSTAVILNENCEEVLQIWKDLNKPENKRIILPDEKLRKILSVKPTEEVSFFSLQRFLSPLFVKKVVVPVVVA